MQKQVDYFEDDQAQVYRFKNQNNFMLPDQLKNNINKRLPRGFALVKTSELIDLAPFTGNIEYVPQKREIRVASQTLAKQFVIQAQLPPTNNKRQSRIEDKGLRFGQLPEGKSKQAEKIKAIIQRFRKHQRYTTFFQHLTKLGFASALNQIENQNRKNIHTIESFKERSLFLFQKVLEVTYQHDKVALINQMIDQLTFLVENALKAEFANSLGLVQKSIDKVTREMSDIRQTGSYYYRRKKRNQKNYDEKQILYIADLIRALPAYQMVGILEIIEEKPFSQISSEKMEFDINTLKFKKIREIQFYTKKKLSNYYRSRQRKQMKIEGRKVVKEDENNKDKNLNQIDYIFQVEEGEEKMKRYESDREIESLEPFQMFSEDKVNEDRQHDDLFKEHSDSPSPHRQASPSQAQGSNLEFQQPNLFPLPPPQKGPSEEKEDEQIVQMDSDSSYITDEQDSDF